jgi:hypothetical protein
MQRVRSLKPNRLQKRRVSMDHRVKPGGDEIEKPLVTNAPKSRA